MFLSFTRPRAELTRRYLPSKSNQTGVTCGLLFSITVARLANAFFVVTRSRNSGGIVPRVAACWGVYASCTVKLVGCIGNPFFTPTTPRRHRQGVRADEDVDEIASAVRTSQRPGSSSR